MAAIEILGYSMTMAEERRGCPRDDHRHQADQRRDRRACTGRRRVRLLRADAGGGGQRDHPQRHHPRHARLPGPPRSSGSCFKSSRPGTTAADEVVRWATPITVFQRTATRDVELGGQPIKAGDRLGLFYRSGQTSTRRSSTHPGGSTSCATPTRIWATAAWARTTAWAPAWPSWRSSSSSTPSPTPCRTSPRPGDPVRLRSGWINGIKSLPVTYRP